MTLISIIFQMMIPQPITNCLELRERYNNQTYQREKEDYFKTEKVR